MSSAYVERTSFLADLTRSSGFFLALGVVGILTVMIVPLPTIVLDLLLSMSIAAAIVILLMAMSVMKPLDFSVFPSVLLIVTLMRLALNVASTRLVLLYGNKGTDAAGQVIKAFGTFVVGGNYVIGFIVFAVLVLINFVVITKGATRIAEVAARFTLDSMPGKQMSIDADLNTGLITESDARRRRREIENEANFYGAMDGASKFVRGDAIAGIIIVLVNLIGGLIIGVLQKGMNVADAARTYSLLTIGDGLVTQIPALIVSTAAGILVTRTSAATELGEELKSQVFSQPKAFALTSFFVFVFALIPGMPKLAFLLVAGGMAFLAYNMTGKTPPAEPEPEAETPMPEIADTVESLTPLDPLGLEVGYGLISLVDANQGGELLGRIKVLRRQLAQELGFIIPAIHIRDNLQLNPNEYSFLIKGTEVAKGELMPGYLLAITPEEEGMKIPGLQTREPAFGLPAVWVPEREKEMVQARGIVMVDPATVLTTHLTEIIKTNVEELIGRHEVQALLDNLAKTHGRILEDLVPKVVPTGLLQKVLQRLLRERVSIRDLLCIIETLADYVPLTKNVDILTGYVRQALARAITRQYQDQNGNVNVVMLSPEIEEIIQQSIQHTEYESFVSPDPNVVKRIMQKIQDIAGEFMKRGLQPIILCSPNVRVHFKKIVDRFFPNITVLAHNEISRDATITSFGMVEI
ncbi:MAG TPA: flagellar biosynthesis protein FlhA [Syntrophales bacterium]|jgi:flagellar biosynthesis protein FlhA|nr:flagellar biosynthesis protein FlhA [Syntrophales bacterium]HON23984.1 flagellar biosynthesis protein FlhA [Syntrophales bacterium]HPC33115.1 flagellar biosynthesis protein FlhA [Syntrophales bacterium]HQG35232.1 flagellar biosynthesis protein FlhA [Syntrophales bacterium]HQI35575.1 flagellar biosynthesis protein FlhA [Syntrophales bacterium]